MKKKGFPQKLQKTLSMTFCAKVGRDPTKIPLDFGRDQQMFSFHFNIVRWGSVLK